VVLEPGEDPLLASHGSERGPVEVRFSEEQQWQAPPVNWLDGLPPPRPDVTAPWAVLAPGWRSRRLGYGLSGTRDPRGSGHVRALTRRLSRRREPRPGVRPRARAERATARGQTPGRVSSRRVSEG
jgi:hypothetical protein